MSEPPSPAAPLLQPGDPRASYLAHKEAIDLAVNRVLDSGWYILGREVAAFEEEFAGYLGVPSAVGVASGTDAIHLALRTCGVGPGDRVFTASHTAVATVAAIELAGAIPVFVDIDPESFTIDPNRLEDALRIDHGADSPAPNGRPGAIIPVHLYGHPADMPAILDIARRHGLRVIEDCAQSHGAALNGRKTGTWGDMAAFSFYPTKNLGALGDGGAVVTSDRELAERSRRLREYGWRERFISESPGMNSRLDEVQAAVLRVKLQHLDRENARRRDLARTYDLLLARTGLILPRTRDQVEHVYHQYVVRSGQRECLRSYLREHGVGTAVHYPVPVHLQPAYSGRWVREEGGLGTTERICQEILSLPMHPQLTIAQAESVGGLIGCWRPAAATAVVPAADLEIFEGSYPHRGD